MSNRCCLLALAGLIVLGLSACSAPEGGDSDLIIATNEVGHYNPVGGYATDGTSPFYDGLLRPQADTGSGPMPRLKPALARAMPEHDDNMTTWTVKLRRDIHFSDGSELTARDVAATYRAVLNPDNASEVADTFRMIKSIDTPDEHTVVFNLKAPTPQFHTRLTLGILPTSAIEDGRSADKWRVNRHPIGTGAYELASLSADTAVLQARADYWRRQPELQSITYQVYEDTNAMTNAVAAGKVDGATVTPRNADHTAGKHHEVITARSADWRGLSLPSDNPLTADVAVRRALNIGIDREKLITEVLDGYGQATSTPVGEFYGDAYNPEAHFRHDLNKARALLSQAGWHANDDNIRVKDGHEARLDILYPADDALRGDIAAEVARQLQDMGIKARTRSSDWDYIMEHIKQDAVVYAGGSEPYSLERQMRGPLHTRTQTSSALDNPSNIAVPGLDEQIEKAARQIDPGQAARDWQQAQTLYMQNPSWLFIAFLKHTYVADTNGWQVPPVTFEPHVHGSEWGPWWDLARWRRDK